MKSIPVVSLSDIAESIQYGHTASAENAKVGPKFLRITDIVPDQIDWNTVPYCTIDEKKFKKFSLESGDIVIARTGATVGYAKLIRNSEPSVFASYLVRIRINPDKADAGYIGRIVESDIYKRFVLSRVGGAAQPNANAKILSSFKLPLPERSVQLRIASILSAYDDLIENNRRRIQLLEQAARLLYKEWFVHFRFPGHEHTAIIDGVPEGWERKSFPDVVDFKEGPGLRNYQYRDKGVPFLNIRTFSDDEIDLSKTKCIDETEVASKYQHFLLREDDHVISSSGTLGRVVTIRSCHLPLMLNTSLIRMRPKGAMKEWFLKAYLKYGDFVDQARSMATGAAQLNYGPSHLKRMSVLTPNTQLLALFEDYVEANYQKIKILLDNNLQLVQARTSLLPRLISGEINV